MMAKQIKASAKPERLIAMSGDVSITAAEMDGDKPKGPPKFSVTAYSGGPLNGMKGWDHPVYLDLSGLTPRKALKANLDHKDTQRVGDVTGYDNDHSRLILSGAATARSAARDEVVGSALDGYQWQASIESTAPKEHTEFLKAGKTATVNGQTATGPAYIVRKSTLKGFAFVTHGADDETTVTIAAAAASSKENDMDPKFKAWLEAQRLDADVIAADENLCQVLQATWEKENPKPKNPKRESLEAQFEAQRREQERVSSIERLGLRAAETHGDSSDRIKEITAEAVESGMSAKDFELELYRIGAGADFTRFSISSQNRTINPAVLEAAICKAGGMPDEKLVRSEKNRHGFDERTLDAMDREFPTGIGLNQFIAICAEMQGFRCRHAGRITVEAQNAAFGLDRNIRASGFSTIVAPTIMSNVANKFLRIGWENVDQTPLRIAAITPVQDFKEISTVSLVADAILQKVGATGEITHANLGEVAYGNKADTYARMLSITRQDYRNDDLRALTTAPRKLGRGAMLALNHIFWAEFLDNSSFFTSGNNNVNTGVADMTIGGLAATETIFMSQTDPNGDPLLSQPAILLVPTALKAAAMTLMSSERLIDGTGTAVQGDANIYRGRFRVESSPYMHNTAYTGYSAQAWYMLANPSDIPVMEIVALDGRVEPVVETAQAAFNVLGTEMRAYCDIGVRKQEFRGGVRADGGSS